MHTHTHTHTLDSSTAFGIVFFIIIFLLLREDKLLGSDLRSVSGVNPWLVLPNCIDEGEWKQISLEITQNKSNIEGRRRGNHKRGQPHIHWLQKQCKGPFITCLMWLNDMEACVHKGFFSCQNKHQAQCQIIQIVLLYFIDQSFYWKKI